VSALLIAAADDLMRFPVDQQLVIAGRAGLGALCGLLIGLERQLAHKVVGLRTHMLVAAAAALATGMGELLFTESDSGDPSRILHAVVTGIGFIGAGAIFRGETRTKGLTTATTLFVAAILGAIAGLGAPVLAIAATVFAVVSLWVLLRAEDAAKLRGSAADD
jgi:putative Mg2+ transporter-C (MgtC) family protein